MSKGIRRRPKSYYMSKAKRAYLDAWVAGFREACGDRLDNIMQGARDVATVITYDDIVRMRERLKTLSQNRRHNYED